MRNLIHHILAAVMSVLAPSRPGRHSAEYLAERPDPACSVSPWSRPWTGPSAAQVREIFRPTEATMRLRTCSVEELERRYAAAFVTIGVDYWQGLAGPDHSRYTAGAAA
ncbi:hypothetical protein Slala05_73590 [Streptomyces lavendulae subsp. lavendulae]|nr:hypothetical protein Slala05_73590 [Streptomyces lavendulae subsp. lavendulae]